MQRVSLRTLALMVELLIAVIAVQYLTMARPVTAGAVWLAGDCGATAQTSCREIDGSVER